MLWAKDQTQKAVYIYMFFWRKKAIETEIRPVISRAEDERRRYTSKGDEGLS